MLVLGDGPINGCRGVVLNRVVVGLCAAGGLSMALDIGLGVLKRGARLASMSPFARCRALKARHS
jgi:hypothetical protein